MLHHSHFLYCVTPVFFYSNFILCRCNWQQSIFAVQQPDSTMDYVKEYRYFINSHYLAEGIRITAGIVLPPVILNYFNLLPVGLAVAVGAMSVSITDNPGPVQHRKNGMIVCIIINTVVALLTGFAASNNFSLAVLILLACFIFSMIAVYGTRANSLGVSALLVMILNTDARIAGWAVIINAAYIMAGAVWYTLLSLLLLKLRPYKLAQQALGEYIIATADYLKARALFYNSAMDQEKILLQILKEQAALQNKQNLVRELLFKSRHVVKQSTNTGITLVMIFTDVVDLFERTISNHFDYQAMHAAFSGDTITEQYRQLILKLGNELDEIGIAVKSARRSVENELLPADIIKTKNDFNILRDIKRTAENVQDFINMRQVLYSIEDIAQRIHTLHLYTGYNKELTTKMSRQIEYDKFITHQPFDFELLRDNLSLQSNYFRHAIRVSIATLFGFIISLFLPLGHSYWILLTIIVILKPAYSLTKKRNYERLTGTVIGALIGFVFLYFITNRDVLFAIMLLLMVGTYSFLRTNYMLSVVFMTPYILLLFHLLSPVSFQSLITDRIIDTAIGSAIAFLANLILLPVWEQDQINNYMAEVIKKNKNYFNDAAVAFSGNPVTITNYKISRKDAFVAQANLSDALTRMQAEPKSKQKNLTELHRFVVLNHLLTTHIAALSYYVPTLATKYASPDFTPLIGSTVVKLDDAENSVAQKFDKTNDKEALLQNNIQDRLNALLQKRLKELEYGMLITDTQKQLSEFKPLADQFNFIDNIVTDIKKVSIKWGHQ